MTKKMLIGWEEWVSLPELGLPAVKAKVDTGAKTSCLHAYNIQTFVQCKKMWIRFDIHPIQKDKECVVTCTAPVVDRRYVSDSGGHKERRYVIETPITLGDRTWTVEITLTDRHSMAFRMLLGREAMRSGRLIVDPLKSCYQGKLKDQQVREYYKK